MRQWCRLYVGTARDDKLIGVAVRSDKPLAVVSWLWLASLESATHAEADGIFQVDLIECAWTLREPVDNLAAIMAALVDAGRIVDPVLDAAGRICGGKLGAWSKRQFQSDISAPRVAKYRASKKSPVKRYSNVTETPPKRYGNAPEQNRTDHSRTEQTKSDSHNQDAAQPDLLIANDDTPPDAVDLKPEHVVEAWNLMAARNGLPTVKGMTKTRKQHIQARLRENTVDDFKAAIAAIERSPFLLGESKDGWRANFDFLLQPSSFLKLLEGQYDKPPVNRH